MSWKGFFECKFLLGIVALMHECEPPSALVSWRKSTASSCTAGLTSPLNLPFEPSLDCTPLIPNKYGADKQRRLWHIGTVLGPIQQLLVISRNQLLFFCKFFIADFWHFEEPPTFYKLPTFSRDQSANNKTLTVSWRKK